jgi:hypothetical protein
VSSLRSPEHRQAVLDDVIARAIANDRTLFAPLTTLVSASLQERDQVLRRSHLASPLHTSTWVDRFAVTGAALHSVADIDQVLDSLHTLIPVRVQQLDGILTGALTSAEPSSPIDETLTNVWREQVRVIALACREAVITRERDLRADDDVVLVAWPRGLHSSNANDMLLTTRAVFGWRHPSNLMLVPAPVAAALRDQYQIDHVAGIVLPSGVSALNVDPSNLGTTLTAHLETCDLLWSESEQATISTLSAAWLTAQNL